MQPDNLCRELSGWVEKGWIRALDLAFVRFLREQDPAASGWALLAAALTSHQLGRGHICLDLQAVQADPQGALSLPPTAESMPAGGLLELLGAVRAVDWEQSLRQSSLVAPGDGFTPLVLSSGRLYLRRYWRYMQQTAEGILQRIVEPLGGPDPVTGSPPDHLMERLDKRFQMLQSPEAQDKSEVHWQSIAAAVAAGGRFTVISGGPGTGKTTAVVRLIEMLQEMALEKGHNPRICLAAPTGKAAARLTESLGSAADRLPAELWKRLPTKATTLHRLLGSQPDSRHFVHNSRNLLHVDVLVVDEASMIDLEMMASLLDALPPQARLVLLGDKDQLASVEAGSVLGDICAHADQPGYWPETLAWLKHHTGYDLQPFAGKGRALDQHVVVLRKSHRFGRDSGIGELARAVNAGDPEKVSAVWSRDFGDIAHLRVQSLADKGFARLVLDGDTGASDRSGSSAGSRGYRGYREYLQIVNSGPGADAEDDWIRAVLNAFGRFQLLAAVRKGSWGVESLNEKTAYLLCREGLTDSTEGWYPGRPVLVTRNDYGLGLMNGDVGIALPVSGSQGQNVLKVVFSLEGGGLKKVPPSRLGDVETVYAMTVHKSQGSEFDHAVLVLPDAMSPVLTRELVYTGITRARNRFTLLTPTVSLLAPAVLRRTHRASGLGELLGG